MSFQPPPQPGQPDYGQQPPPQQPPPPPPGYAPPPPPGYAPPPPPPHGYAPPPPQGYAPPPPPGYAQPAYSAPTGPSFKFDPASVNPMDWAILGVAFLTFIFSFFDYYTVSVSGVGLGSYGGSESAWHGFFGWFAVLVALASAAVIGLELFAPQIKLPFPGRLIALGGFVLALLCVLLALLVFPESVPSGFGIDTGRGFGYWADLVLIVALVVLGVLRLKATGGKLPWEKGPSGPAAGYGGPVPPQGPPPGYPQG